ncbi:NUDIX domain-containing protein [Streptomyces sp. NPDC057636]|uniref:NUDIX domain-containing protein n=1 Tax=Streptomyces sp. NPDC057636 TaxID=3346189 RepID=UPI0036B79862
MNYRQLTPLLGVPTEGEPTPLDELQSNAAEVWDAYQESRYGFATRRLPLVLADALIAAQAYQGEERERAHELMAMTHQGAAMVLTKVGETDLAWIAADRGLAAAQQSGNTVVTGSLFRSVAHCLLSNGRFDAAVQLVGDASDHLRPGLDDASPEFLSIYGTLFLAGSLAAARAEVEEELGFTPPLGRLLAVDWAPSTAEGDKVLYVFDGGQLTAESLAAVTLQADELKDLAFLSPDEINGRTIPRLARRILAAVEARSKATPIYLEHGQQPE